MRANFVTAAEAAAMIKDGDTVAAAAMTLVGVAESIMKALETRFLEKGTPRDLTFVHASGQCDRERGIQHLAHEGRPLAAVLQAHQVLALLAGVGRQGAVELARVGAQHEVVAALAAVRRQAAVFLGGQAAVRFGGGAFLPRYIRPTRGRRRAGRNRRAGDN